MYLLMNENEAIYEFKIDRESNLATDIKMLKKDSVFSIEDINEFLDLRLVDMGFFRRHKKNVDIARKLEVDLCEKEILSLMTNYTSTKDTVWVKEADSTVSFEKASKRLSSCRLEYDTALYVHCGRNTTNSSFENLFRLKGISLVFIKEGDCTYFNKSNFAEVTSDSKDRKAFIYVNKEESKNIYKMIKYLKSIDICTFSIDEMTKSLVIDEIKDPNEYDTFKSIFGSIANFYTLHRKNKNKDIETTMWQRGLCDEELRYCIVF